MAGVVQQGDCFLVLCFELLDIVRTALLFLCAFLLDFVPHFLVFFVWVSAHCSFAFPFLDHALAVTTAASCRYTRLLYTAAFGFEGSV